MSLTSILKSPKNPELKAWFKEHFANPGFGEKRPILVPSGIENGTSIVGSAFDYLFRFSLERRHALVVHKRPEWVAEIGLGSILTLANLAGDWEIGIGFKGDHKWVGSVLAGKASEAMLKAKSGY